MSNFIRLSIMIMILAVACGKDNSPTPIDEQEDYSIAMVNKEIIIPVGSRQIKGFLSKPTGAFLDIVLVLHGGSLDYETSVQATLNQATKSDGGEQFLKNGRAIFSLEYTEFSGPADTVGVTKGIMELEDVLAAIDLLKTDPFEKNNFIINKLYAFGHSRGGANALLAGIERPIDAAISAEGPLNWEAIRDSTASGFLTPEPRQLFNFNAGTAAWNENPELWVQFSPALRLEEFQSPFMVIAGELDEATFQDMAIQMKNNYDNCTTCQSGGLFIFHPNGHTDWGLPAVLDSIQSFVNRN